MEIFLTIAGIIIMLIISLINPINSYYNKQHLEWHNWRILNEWPKIYDINYKSKSDVKFIKYWFYTKILQKEI